MSEKLTYLECWIGVATSLLSQALAGEPTLTESLPKPMLSGSFGFAATVSGEEEGRFSVLLEGTLADASLLGEGTDQKAGWAELLKEVADAAAGDLLAKTGRKCQITAFAAIDNESKLSRAFQLKDGERSWSIQVYNGVKPGKPAKASAPADPLQERREKGDKPMPSPSGNYGPGNSDRAATGVPREALPGLSAGLQLLLDVELEASLRFGAREMPLGEILDLGPGDVVQLDRHISDAVDLIVGDKIVARGDVVLVNGNFGLRVTEVAEPQRRLESIRCLF
jgi:flagellar motor switch protein FliN